MAKISKQNLKDFCLSVRVKEKVEERLDRFAIKLKFLYNFCNNNHYVMKNG